MPNYTDHLKLRKPLQEEFYNIDEHNNNMDILDTAIKALSESSGVVISPDEPDSGDVWIDTDENDEGGDFTAPVTSVNGKTGEVVITAKDLDAYNTGETYSKTEVNELLGGKAASSHNHSASDINSGTLAVARGGTGNSSVDTTPTSGSTKMVTSDGIYKALANKAPSSHNHPASAITGLAEQISSLGYAKIATGSYVGDCGVAGQQTSSNYYYYVTDLKSKGRQIILPFAPSVIIVFQNENTHDFFVTTAGREYKYTITNTSANAHMRYLENNIFYCDGTPSRFTVRQGITLSSGYDDYPGCNRYGTTYYWIAF